MTSLAGRPWLTVDALRWASEVPWRGWIWVMPVAAVGAVTSAFVEESIPCSPTDPSVCAPDPTIAALALLGLSALLVRWWPLVAATCGVLFSVADLLLDQEAVLAFSAYLVLCVGLAADVQVRRTRQRRLAGEAAQSLAAPPMVHRGVRPVLGTVALGLVGVAAAQWWFYQHTLASRAEHLAHAVTVDTVAEGEVGDYDQRFRLVDPEPWMPRVVRLEPLEAVPRGQSWPVRIDRTDSAWIEAVAEPQDTSGWLIGVVAALVLAGLAAIAAPSPLLAAVRSGRRQVLRARVALDLEEADLVVLPFDSTTEVAVLNALVFPTVDPVPSSAAEAEQDDTAPMIREVSLVGDLRHRGWVEMVHDDGYTVAGRLLARPCPRPRASRADGSDENEQSTEAARFVPPDPTVPVTASDALPPPVLPLTVPSVPRWRRRRALALCLTIPAIVPAAVWWLADSRWECLIAGLFLTWPLTEAGALGDPRMERERLTLPLGLTQVRVPWSAVRRIAHDEEYVEVEGSDWQLGFEAFPATEPPEDRATEVRRLARQMQGLIEDTGHHDAEPHREVVWLAPYLVVSLLVGFAAFTARFLSLR